jgi:hypothetical protein
MAITSLTRLVGVLAVLVFAGQVTLAAAEEPKKDKKAKATAPAAGQPGGGVQSTKASGADKVSKARACSGVAPTVKKVTPDEGKTGDKVAITGENFGDPGCVTGVSFGPGSPAKFTHMNDTTITATVPEGKKGLEILTVTNSTGESSKPFLRK